MKFSEFFASPGVRRLSVILGILAGIGTTMFTDWRIGVLAGAVVTLLASIVLPIIFYVQFLPYARIKKELNCPFLFDEPVRFTVKHGTVGGFFILTEKSMIFLSLECTTHMLELPRDKVKQVSAGKDMTLDVYLSNTQFVRVFSAVREELIEILRENGWNITE